MDRKSESETSGADRGLGGLAPGPSGPADPRNALERFIGGSVHGVALRLLVLSLLAGIVMGVLGVTPGDLLVFVETRIAWLGTMGLDTLRAAGSYVLLGAAIVLPAWLVWRIFRAFRI